MVINTGLLNHRYLWATGRDASQFLPGERVSDRYQVIAPQVWQDTRPDQPISVPELLPHEILPYLRLYPKRLHVPGVYGYAITEDRQDVLLLENAPFDGSGNLLPSIIESWSKATSVRQVYWLWQMLQLWTPLVALGVAPSLLIGQNIRVEGWRVRLLELHAESMGEGATVEATGEATVGATMTLVKAPTKASLQQLGQSWAAWFTEAKGAVAGRLEAIFADMQRPEVKIEDVVRSLNQLLLEQAAQQPLRLRLAGATDTGPKHKHNEDTCYPLVADLPQDYSQPINPLLSHLAIVCDGIGGHEGGEVASQLAVQSLKMQVQAMLTELQEDPELMSPDLVEEQLEAIVRVANNLIASRNDEQGRESRRRMGTTLVMALQLPQKLETPGGSGNSHELYLVHVGDSRAYWMTRNYCQLLTVDDDVSTREVRMGRSLYWEALQRPDAGALTQALGTRDGELLRPTVQRFILEEDGVLLLCSDGLSDNHWVEQSWADYAPEILSGKMNVETAVQSLVELANQKNGHDNATVVISYCRVSPEHPVALNFGQIPTGFDTEIRLDPNLPSSPYAAYHSPEEAIAPETPKPQRLKVVLGSLALLVTVGAIGLTLWGLLNPVEFKQFRDRVEQSLPLGDRLKPQLPPIPSK